MIHLLTKILRDTFIDKVGKFHPQMFGKKTFALPRKEDEEGYRNLEVVIYAPMNYVQVWIRETADVISHEDMIYNEDDDEMFCKPGKDYVKSATPWKLVADHDSSWTEGISTTLREYGPKLTAFTGGGDWFKVIEGEFKPTKVSA